MPRSWVYEHPIGTLDLSVQHLGAHLVVCISGSDVPHIGSVVLATPRPSLSGSGASATSSVLNRIGHKDEFVGRIVAEVLASQLDTVVCCVCGVHKDDASADQIAACAPLGDELAAFLLERIPHNTA
ncbi:hypothetical protein [Anaerotardibacter muris]|uniref:prenylated flavin chaperone LpdD n=1 Tax=Anaerotardibacter muris TaxID=2941505 RepID=UPI00203B28EB|nr:hypothetical protein [Anaerotardibacter muris]